jgi:uncharacterized membrane protein YedE/YeeE
MLDLVPLIDRVGEPAAAALGGLVLGVVFGWAAQRSRFCLRAAVVEFARGAVGPRTSVWLLAFSTAVFWTQAVQMLGMLDLAEARMLALPGSISGAIVGGLLFGAGMILARGCAGRLLVLAGTGNLRALLSGLVFAVTAQMCLRGALAPMRSSVAGAWTTGPRNVEIIGWLGLGELAGVAFGAACAVIAIVFAVRNRVSPTTLVAGSAVGASIALGWLYTYTLSTQSFDPTQVESISFTGPSADTLMFFLSSETALDFDIGLVPGVFLGAFLAAWRARELRLQGFQGGASMPRYLIGAAMMGLGGMLAGGCAIGAGVTGGSAFALSAWVALSAMWVGAAATDALTDRRTEGGGPELVAAEGATPL